MAGIDGSSDTSMASLSEEASGELEALQAIYSADGEFAVEYFRCSEDDASSSFICRVTIKPKDMLLGLCLSLPVSYPQVCPRMEIVAVTDSVPEDRITRLLMHLYNVAQSNLGMPLIFSVMEEAKEWMREQQIAAVTTATEDDAHEVLKKKAAQNQRVKQQQTNKDQFGRQTKKPPMKTASDVIARIQWDDQLDAQHFTVAYLDRFIGVVEQPFSAFSWEDIASVDYNTLAIPRHRIQYFKYKDEVVWDKTKRLDNVFGSVGSGTTIVDVMNRYSKENAVEKSGDEKDMNEMDDFEMTDVHSTTAEASEKKHKKRVNRSRPNYFIAVHIEDEDIKSHVAQIHDDMTCLDPLVTPYLTPPAHLHITLCMLNLATEAQINTALSVLKSIQQELQSLLLPVTILSFQGIDAFHDRIIFTSPQEDSNLEKVARCLINALSSAGINLSGTRDEFTPHLTIMKMPREEMSGHPIFASEFKSKYADLCLGVQAVDAIHLCSLDKKPPHDKFYSTLAKIDLVE